MGATRIFLSMAIFSNITHNRIIFYKCDSDWMERLRWSNIIHVSYCRTHGFVVRGESPGCRLISKASMLEWLRSPPPPPLTGEQYGKMEPKYPEGGHCQSVLRPHGVFNVPLYFK